MKKMEWTFRARKEFDDTYLFWIEHNQSDIYSEKLLDETLRKINLIAQNAKVGEENKKKKLRRVLIIENFSVVYREDKNAIKIISFFDNRRKPE